MGRISKCVSLQQDVWEHIEESRRNNSFDFSEWINLTYRKSFMSLEGILDQIKKKHHEIEVLEEHAKIVKVVMKTTQTKLSSEEVNFLSSIPQLIKEGKEWTALWRRFNFQFEQDLDFVEFQQLVKAVKEDGGETTGRTEKE